MTLRKRIILAGIAVAALALVALPSGADTTSTQTITASVASSITMTTTPTATIPSWSLAPTGANTTSGGQVVVTANVPYKVTVQSDKATMTKWDGSAYDNSKSLTTALSVQTALASGIGVPVASVPVSNSATANIATGAGLATDTYNITLAQPTVVTDAPATYHLVLTYTATASP